MPVKGYISHRPLILEVKAPIVEPNKFNNGNL